MKITRKFNYLNQSHIISFHYTMRKNWVELDGIRYNDIKDYTTIGIIHLELPIVLEEDKLVAILYRKKIYILKDDNDIEIGKLYLNSCKKSKLSDALFLLNFLPSLFVAIDFFQNTFTKLSQLTENYYKTRILFLLTIIVFESIAISGIKWCTFFRYHPELPKTKKIGFSVVVIGLVNIISIGLIIVAKLAFKIL